ncbi:hypothetical protein FJT64_022447 [Amphibalanus amphitrite]|uniref:Uncharacterized protein n=1 Tax=Amphibalanus amphitrite TaxID=1232801 RepID=A0A6A4WV85_AMPAM|nr:hypothetical protein FJT64_022447 [Amphibalanus amphitrite]
MTKQEAKEKKMTKEEEKEKKMTKENEEKMSKEKTMMKEVNELCASSEGDENLTPVTPQDESHKVFYVTPVLHLRCTSVTPVTYAVTQ